jgi:hypothetical protein
MWSQVYDPLNSKILSTIVAALPVVTLLVLIASNKIKAHWAAIKLVGQQPKKTRVDVNEIRHMKIGVLDVRPQALLQEQGGAIHGMVGPKTRSAP